MSSSDNNITFKKTSFLSGINSEFIPDKNEVFLKVILLSDEDINNYFNINY